GIGADRARLDSRRADPTIAKRTDRLAADRGPRGRLDPALRNRLYRVPAAGSAGLRRVFKHRGEKARRACRRGPDPPGIFFQPAGARVVAVSRFLATTSQFTITGLAVAVETVSTVWVPPMVSAQPMRMPRMKRMVPPVPASQKRGSP